MHRTPLDFLSLSQCIAFLSPVFHLFYTMIISLFLISFSHLPFFNCSFFTISQMFLSTKDKILDKLEGNNFTKNMIKHVNGFSKDNHTCSYADEKSILNTSKKHISNCLKIFHVNIESFKKHGTELSIYLKCLSQKFDILCITEIRHTTVGLINKDFPDFHVFIDDPSTAKGGVAFIKKR